MADEPHLDRAREELGRASDAADRTVQNQVDSLVEGIFEEQDGHRTQSEPGPKADRIAEVVKKLDGLEAEAGGAADEHIAAAREHCREYLKRTDGDS